ncbi:response regulator [Undibacterium flavidum]|uniref:histidine kinase n=1 Tax=Undibacterium flavidum TaxID=2762297 RepID=A0ABR6Y7U6_9BURK|nr:response regulator [Undibacterium flavidum]MBC3872698.1 response regulator [Undibacterium flavidum]
MTVARRMMVLTGVIVLGIMIVTGSLLYMLERVYNSANAGNTNVVPSLVILDEMREGILQTRIQLRSHVLNNDPAAMYEIERKLDFYQKQTEQQLKAYEFNGCGGVSCFVDETDANYIRQIKLVWDQYQATLQPIIAESRRGAAGTEKSRALIAEIKTSELEKKISALIDEHILYNIDLARKNSDGSALTKTNAFIISSILGFILIISVLILGNMTRRSILKILGGEPAVANNIVKRIADGNLHSTQDLQDAAPGSLLASVKKMAGNLEALASQADTVGRGDLSVEVHARSEHDRLGHAFKNMVNLLRIASQEDQQRNWLKDGINQLNQQLTGDLSSQQMVDIAISTLGRYLGAGRGVLYIWRSHEEKLDLLGSYMYSERSESCHLPGHQPGNQSNKQFQLGEGAVGQVARERKPIILTTINQDGAPIVTGTSSVQPLFTYTYPLLREDTLLGVIELASVDPYDEVQLSFLGSAVETIASFLYVAEQQNNIRELLGVAEKAELEARTQSEYLQQANSQMEEQQQQLQQQSEELRQTNAQMQEQQRLLEQNNESLRTAQAETAAKAKQLEQAGQYKSEFLANMSHELRTPLNAIILLSKMMMKNADGTLIEEDVKRAEVIHRSGRDLLGLINDVLDLSKIEAGRMDLSFSAIGSADFLQNLSDTFTPLSQERGVAFVIDDQFNDEIVTDQDKLAQILRNLLSNAFKFTKKGQVKLSLSYREQDPLPLHIEVSDSGIGIPADRQEAIFEAFRQADGSTSREFGGTGLGLTISLRIAQLLGGTIKLHSIAGHGSTFSLCLPRVPESLPLPTAAATSTSTTMQLAHRAGALSSAGSQSTSTPAIQSDDPNAQLAASADDRNNLQLGDKVILLIDDDYDFGLAVITINRRQHYKTLLATNGADGLVLAKKYRPTGILLDLGLPDMHGIDLLHEFKTTQELAAIPVYIVSASDRTEIHEQRDIVGYLQKPVNREQLVEAEKNLLAAVLEQRLEQRSDAILVLANGGICANEIQQLFAQAHKTSSTKMRDWTNTPMIDDKGDSLNAVLAEDAWSLCIIDLTNRSIDQGISLAKQVQNSHPKLALLFFSSASLIEEDELRLRPYTDSIIVKAPRSPERLLDNIERFLSNIKQTQSKLHATGKVHELQKINGGQQKSLEKIHILVVDDDLRNLFVITQALEQNGAKVDTAVNGRQALEMLEKNPVDLVFMDIMMPEMDGFKTIEAVRATPHIAHTRIVALTAKAMLQDRQKIIEVGANDYLSKPVDYDDLIRVAIQWSSTGSSTLTSP